MDPVRLAVLLAGVLFLAFGLAVYRHFYKAVGATAGLALWMASRDTLVRFPGLRDHPGAAGLLLLVLLLCTGVFLAIRFRRVIVFLGGVGTGMILSRTAAVYLTSGDFQWTSFRLGGLGAMDVLAGLVAGVLFLLFEKFLAVLLTSAVGGLLCAWALGGRWTFPLCLALGLVAQPLIFARFGSPGGGGKSGSGKGRTGTFVAGLLLVMLFPGSAGADWVVERTVPATSRVVVAAGWRDGVRMGERYAVLGGEEPPAAVIEVQEVFSGSFVSLPIPEDVFERIRAGMPVKLLEEYAFDLALKYGGEPRLEAFLRDYPDSSHREEITQALDETRFGRARFEGTIEAYRQFQRLYPTSRFASRARKLEEELTFRRAVEEGTEGALTDFLDRFPDSSRLSGPGEVRAYLAVLRTGKVFAYQDFMAAYPGSRLAEEFVPKVEQFERWVERLEFGDDPVAAIRHFGEAGDETAVPYLVGKLTVEDLSDEAGKAILSIGEPALGILMEVLISPLQSTTLKDEVAMIIARMGEISAIPAMRTYVKEEGTAAGKEALLKLEQKVGR